MTLYDRGNIDMDDGEYLRAVQRALFTLSQFAEDNGLSGNAVDAAKELIRCRVLGCGLGGACDGVGLGPRPCPLKEDQ